MAERFPGYDVLSKRDTPSWNEVTREVIERRLATPREPRFFTASEWRTLEALCGRILPQPPDRPAAAGCVLQSGAPRDLCRRGGARGAAHGSG